MLLSFFFFLWNIGAFARAELGRRKELKHSSGKTLCWFTMKWGYPSSFRYENRDIVSQNLFNLGLKGGEWCLGNTHSRIITILNAVFFFFVGWKKKKKEKVQGSLTPWNEPSFHLQHATPVLNRSTWPTMNPNSVDLAWRSIIAIWHALAT